VGVAQPHKREENAPHPLGNDGYAVVRLLNPEHDGIFWFPILVFRLLYPIPPYDGTTTISADLLPAACGTVTRPRPK